ncbi:Hypothetical predicted protein [Olea europaea subsp. europaea]|uniref:Uncharacterized protein n=1 Tax=Olea europaea subsp. europaea TaxID=158383 RepID=A0A8S0QRP4_OLEEU|nr:Hypothetical predicted protein [Olea europaea subsp. europaea]
MEREIAKHYKKLFMRDPSNLAYTRRQCRNGRLPWSRLELHSSHELYNRRPILAAESTSYEIEPEEPICRMTKWTVKEN